MGFVAEVGTPTTPHMTGISALKLYLKLKYRINLRRKLLVEVILHDNNLTAMDFIDLHMTFE